MDTEAEFQAAADHLASSVASESGSYDDGAKLEFYGLYKQATAGVCTGSRPGFWNLAGRAKWDAWHALDDLPAEAAMRRYVELLSRLTPSWDSAHLVDAGPASWRAGGGGGGISGPVFSCLAQAEEEPAAEGDATSQEGVSSALHELAGQGDLPGLQAALAAGAAVDGRDGSGCTALHFAADRGAAEGVLRCLASAGADLEARDEDGQTPLHYAALCGREAACRTLLELGADASAEDSEGQVPQAAGPSGWTFWPPRTVKA